MRVALPGPATPASSKECLLSPAKPEPISASESPTITLGASGILATRSSWSPPLGDSLRSALLDIEPGGRLDLGAVAEQGAFEAAYPSAGEITLSTSEPDAALMFFLTRLYGRLQQLGTVTAVDLAAYARPLEAD